MRTTRLDETRVVATHRKERGDKLRAPSTNDGLMAPIAP